MKTSDAVNYVCVESLSGSVIEPDVYCQIVGLLTPLMPYLRNSPWKQGSVEPKIKLLTQLQTQQHILPSNVNRVLQSTPVHSYRLQSKKLFHVFRDSPFYYVTSK